MRNGKSWTMLAMVAALAVGCGDGSAPQAGGDATLPAGVYPLSGASDDLAPLDGMVGSAKVVGLGESIHTSGGFEREKARVFKYLVEHLGFRALALETPWKSAEMAGQYVASCQGDPRQALGALFPVWRDKGMFELLQWMCQYNQAHPGDPVSFFGFDVQQPWDDGATFRAFASAAAPSDADALATDVASCDGATSASESEYDQAQVNVRISDADFAGCNQGLAAADDYLNQHGPALIAASSAPAFTRAKLALAGLSAWEGQKYGMQAQTPEGLKAAFESRDLGMAEALETLHGLIAPTGKTVIWAHNDHLAMDTPDLQIPQLPQTPTGMGTILAQQFGTLYVPIALVGYQVDINWPGVGVGPLAPPTAPDAVEVLLHGLGRPELLVDLDFPGARAPFFAPGKSYQFGPDAKAEADRGVPRQQFRALLYLDQSPALEQP